MTPDSLEPPSASRQSLDGRTKARKQFDAIASGIAEDLQGSDRLSTVQLHLIEAFAGCAIAVNAINAKLLAGEEIEITDLSQAASTLVRIASRIGLERVAREIDGLGDLMRSDQERQRQQAREQREARQRQQQPEETVP